MSLFFLVPREYGKVSAESRLVIPRMQHVLWSTPCIDADAAVFKLIVASPAVDKNQNTL
jgi:hypothetical protein